MLAQARKRLPPGATNWPKHCPTIKLWLRHCSLTVTLRLGIACTAALSQQVWACRVPTFWRCRTPPTPLAARQAKSAKMQIGANIWYKRISIARYMQFLMRWDNTNGPRCILDWLPWCRGQGSLGLEVKRASDEHRGEAIIWIACTIANLLTLGKRCSGWEISRVCMKMKCLEIVEQRKKGKFGLIRTNKGDAASKIH